MRRIHVHYMLLPLLLLFAVHPLLSQEVIFNRVPAPEEQPWPWITGITQDPRGFMWFAGADGLYRHDGLRTSFYKYDSSNLNSISLNIFWCIHADKAGVIWIGTLGCGLYRFDPASQLFTHYRYNEKNLVSLSSDKVQAIYEDREGFLWVGTDNGLNRFDKNSGKFTRYLHQVNDPGTLSCNDVRTIYEDKQGVLWIGTGSFWSSNEIFGKEGGLNRMDKKTGRFKKFLHDPNDGSSLIDNRVGAIFEDSHGTFWVGTAGDGLHTLDRATGKFTRHQYDSSRPDKLSRPPVSKALTFVEDHIMFITEDSGGSIWIGTLMSGITRYDLQTKKTRNYYTDNNSEGGFNDQSGWAAYTSKDGILWISTWQQSIFRIDPQKTRIPRWDIGKPVRALHKDQHGYIWVACDSSFMEMRDDKKIIKTYHAKDLVNINAIQKDTGNKIWVATYNGLFLFDSQTDKLVHYKHDAKDSGSLINDGVLSLCKTSNGKLWVGTAEGLDQFDAETGKFIHFSYNRQDSNSAPQINIYKLLEDAQERLWIGTGSLSKFEPKTGKFKTYLNGRYITGLLQDSRGILWVGARNGFYRFDQSSDAFVPFSDPQTGKKITKVSFIIEDDEKALWVLTNSSLLKLNAKRDRLSVYGNSFGVKPNNRSDYLDAVKTNTGEIFFVDEDGVLYSFFPSRLKGNDIPALIDFVNLNFSEQSGRGIQNASINSSLAAGQNLRLNHNQNVFSIDYAVMHYSSPENNQHYYMLENYDNDRRQGGPDQRAYYFNVPAGRYVFKVKASSDNGIWSEKSIAITVLPPWWRTWWAYCIYSLAFIAFVFAVHRYQKARVIKAERERSRTKELAQAKEIETAYHKLEETHETLKATQKQLIHSEKMASLGELTAGIAHEIQNPLNFVNNFSEVNNELIDDLKHEAEKGNINEVKIIADDIKENSEKINHHGKRADAIVKGMLQHSKTSTGVKELTDINKLADEYLRLAYHGFRARDKEFNVEIKVDLDKSIDKINVVAQDIGRVLLNLFNNAFYAVNEKAKLSGISYQVSEEISQYMPTVSVTTKKTAGKTEIIVQDNGNGIPQNIIDKIFQPFFTTKPTGQGTGLGLSLAYDIVKAHNGQIKVETKEGEGSEFIVQLPV